MTNNQTVCDSGQDKGIEEMVEDFRLELQKELKAPKNQRNNFGNYNYRSTEDIVEAVKPLLEEGTILKLTDDIVEVGGRVYVKATALITDGKETIEATAYAREAVTKKGMDEAQITGAASSYARKYALNGLLLIDDTKDADTQDNRNVEVKKPTVTKADVDKAETIEQLRALYPKADDGLKVIIEAKVKKLKKDE